MPVWVSYWPALAVIVPMAAVRLTRDTFWLGIERTMIILLATAYVANTIAELADMIGVITLHPSGKNAFSLLSSAVAIWVANVLIFPCSIGKSIEAARTPGRASQAKAGLGLSATGETGRPAARLAAVVPRLSISWIQHGDGFQSD